MRQTQKETQNRRKIEILTELNFVGEANDSSDAYYMEVRDRKTIIFSFANLPNSAAMEGRGVTRFYYPATVANALFLAVFVCLKEMDAKSIPGEPTEALLWCVLRLEGYSYRYFTSQSLQAALKLEHGQVI